MKKLIAILTIAIVLVGAVFATSAGSATINVQAKVEKFYPGFQLTGTLHDDSSKTTTSSDTVTGHAYTDGTAMNLNTGKFIDIEDVVVDFTLVQKGSEGTDTATSKKYAKCGNTFYFDIEVGNMTIKTKLDGTTAATDAEKAANTVAATGTGDAGAFVFSPAQANTIGTGENAPKNKIAVNAPSDGDYELTATYSGIVYDDQEIGSFSAKWAKSINLIDGNYEAEVKVTITMN